MPNKIFLLTLITLMVVIISGCSSLIQDHEIVPQTGKQGSLPATWTAETKATEEISTPEDTPDSVSETANTGFTVVDTNQAACYNDSLAISCPTRGEDFFGQDAQYTGNQPAYEDNGDGTITDLNTGLTWIKDAGIKVDYYEGIALAEDFVFAGFDDWRVPSIKELYSLMDFSGIDDADAATDPFINTDFFIFQYGDTSAGDRAIDSQWITKTLYVDSVMGNQECFFGVNFADGRIKCYPTQEGRNNGYYLRLVRGESYGKNIFQGLDNGIIADLATGLDWQQADSGEGMDWPTALASCESATTGGYDDWRLPNAKELQSIVDYSRSPGTTSSAAIDPIFDTTMISNLNGEVDYPYFWTSTTHANKNGGGFAVYISFGHGMGQINGSTMDVHGAGSQRSDPKTGDEADYPTSFGPQGDIRRLTNFVRCVRGGVMEEIIIGGEADNSAFSQAGSPADPNAGSEPAGKQGPNLAEAASILDVSVQELQDALGPPPPDLASAAKSLGVSEQVLIEALGLPGGPPP